MSKDVEATLRAALHKIAPDIDIADIDRGADLREEFDIDSMDFLNLVTALGKELGLAMPEAAYAQMGSYDALLGYLQKRAG